MTWSDFPMPARDKCAKNGPSPSLEPSPSREPSLTLLPSPDIFFFFSNIYPLSKTIQLNHYPSKHYQKLCKLISFEIRLPISLLKISSRRLDLSFLHFIVDFVPDIEVLRRQIHHLRHSIHRAVVRIELTELNAPRLIPVHQLKHCFHLLAAERSIQFTQNLLELPHTQMPLFPLIVCLKCSV